MNKGKLKAYAPVARQDFIKMVRQRADLLGLTKKEIAPAVTEGEFAVIEGRPYPKHYAASHKKLAGKIKTEGVEQFVERVAYSWFNRFAALRFMEVNNFLAHGFRVLSNREQGKSEPEILTHAAEVDLPGLDKEKVLELKLDGNRDAELYKMLIVAQSNELNRAMPFLFERVNDETEILLPDNLLASDSVIRKMVAAIDEEDWKQVEIIGWLYQFYISEKKDEVIGKTVKSEDIPAATQLFTPNWIVKYMTQNSLGRLWLESNPHSQLAANMEFYIKPAEENAPPANQHSALNPEDIKILDPACGSGHILVEAYELLKAIYTERGYSSRDVPRLILEKNLFGLDIDERARQMAAFALMMKARTDDRRLFEADAPQLNIETIPDSSQLANTPAEIAEMFFSDAANPGAVSIRDSNFLFGEMETQPSLVLSEPSAVAGGSSGQSRNVNFNEPTDKVKPSATADSSDISEQNIVDLLELFAQGKTLGSLIRVPHGFAAVVERLEQAIETKLTGRNFLEQIAARQLEPFVRAARMLVSRYDCVIANPPYMGGKGMNGELKTFAAKNFPDSKSDLFAMFIERAMEHLKPAGSAAFVTPFVWMFISSYEKFRKNLIEETPLTSLIQLEYNAFEPACVPVCTFVVGKNGNSKLKGEFIKLSDFRGHQNQAPKVLEAIENANCGWRFQSSTVDFEKIPGSPIAYWVSDKMREVVSESITLGEITDSAVGLQTGDNTQFLRLWYEVNFQKIGFGKQNSLEAKESLKKWFPHNKGGDFRKWYGNNEYVVNWENDGEDIKKDKLDRFEKGLITDNFKPKNTGYYFREAITWSDVTSSANGFRYCPDGFIPNIIAPTVYLDSLNALVQVLQFCNTIFASWIVRILNPTMHFHVGYFRLLPFATKCKFDSTTLNILLDISKKDWDSFETSWDFTSLPLLEGVRGKGLGISEEVESSSANPSSLNPKPFSHSVEECWNRWRDLTEQRIARMQHLETENNRLFIAAYGLEDELAPEVPLAQITLARADAEKDVRRLLSYFVACLMGRYSLDETGLIYADAGGKGFDSSVYQTFAADDDGIVPVTDLEWFPQEAARQFEKFIKVVLGEADSSQNLRWIAEQLGAKAHETPVETVRRYFSTSFFKDHIQTYKKRPIYWLFSSGKQKAFECLVYLHRYNDQTLARMRHEYVLPLMNKLTAQIEIFDQQIENAETTSEANKLGKQKEILIKKQTELAGFDEKLRHYSDMKIALDLDDGVKVNYGKFGDLLADVKQIATTKE